MRCHASDYNDHLLSENVKPAIGLLHILGARQHRRCGLVRRVPADSRFQIWMLYLRTTSTIALTLGAATLAATAFAQHSGLSPDTVRAKATGGDVAAMSAVVVGIDRARYTHPKG